jgi:3-oxoadipate enol-lactonase
MTFIEINGHNIHYSLTKGKGNKTFLLINSLGTDFRIWDKIVEPLTEYGSVLRFDKQGHGLSQTALQAYLITAYASDTLKLLDYLKVKKVTLIGSSIGGIIGQHIAVHHPNYIDKLILSNSAPKVGTTDIWDMRIKKVQEEGLKSISDGIMKAWFSEYFHIANTSELKGYKTMLENSNIEGYIKACFALKENDLTSSINQITLPTLCIAGSVDGSTPPNMVEAMAKLIPNAQYSLINGVGHLPFIEKPKEFMQVLFDFMFI